MIPARLSVRFRRLQRHAEIGEPGVHRGQTALDLAQAAQDPSEVRMAREDDIGPRRIDEAAVGDTQRARRKAQPAADLAQLLRVPLGLDAQRTGLGVQPAQFPDQLEELPVPVLRGHPASLCHRTP